MKTRDDKAVKFDFITDFTAPEIRRRLLSLSDQTKSKAFEIRIKTGAPIMLSTNQGCMPLGAYAFDPSQTPYTVTKEDMDTTFEFVTGASIHAVLEELKYGFVTISGGHRVGVCGKAVMERGEILSIRDISSLNFRIAHEIVGCADKVIGRIIDGGIRSTLVISPPSCGKTTLLRDIARQLSNGVPHLHFSGVKVGVIDERSEICGMYRGKPQNDIGVRTDVLDLCPKSLGIGLMLRSMSPDVIITDELLYKEDVRAVMQAHNTGVSVIASVHGKDAEEIRKKRLFYELFGEGVFSLAITLSNTPKIGTPSVCRL